MDIPTPLVVTIAITKSDFYFLQRRFLLKRFWSIPISIGILLFIFNSYSVSAGLSGLALGAVSAPLMAWWMPYQQWRTNKKKNPNWGAPTIYTFSESGISMQWPATSVRYDWIIFKRFRETEKYFLIYLPSGFFYFIPKRELTDAEQDSMREILCTLPPDGKKMVRK